jgi:hypothetical protein
MSDDDYEVPEGWTEVDTAFDQQHHAFMRGRDGLVLSVEEGTVGRSKGRYAVAALPENFRDDNQPIRSYGDSGYIHTGDDLDAAIEAAVEWMDEYPEGGRNDE